MPALIRQHDGVGLPVLGEHGDRLLVNFALDLLPPPVQAAELLRKLLRARRAVGEKQLRRHVHLAHAPGGVDARRERIADEPGGHGCFCPALRHERGESHALRLAQRGKPLRDHRAVLAHERHHIRHRAEAQKVAVPRQQRLLVAGERGGELERHAHASQPALRAVRLVGAVRIDDRRALRQLRLALVMVGDDQINIFFAAQKRLIQRRDAAVHRDDQAHALRAERFDGGGIQTVALLQPRGDVADHIAAALAQKFRQQTGGGDAVHVIIAEHADFFVFIQRPLHARAGALHVQQREGVGQRTVRRQKRVRRLGRVIAAAAQHRRRDGGVARALERVRLPRLILAGNCPGSVLHSNTHPVYLFIFFGYYSILRGIAQQKIFLTGK